MPIGKIIEFLFFFIMLLISVYVANLFFQFLPIPQGQSNSFYAPETGLINFFFTVWDNSFLFLFAFVFFIGVMASYRSPSKTKGFASIILLLGLAFFSIVVNLSISALAFLNPSTYLPQSTAFFTNNYYLVIAFFCTILSIIFNFRRSS